MDIDLAKALSILKECGSLGLLFILIWRGIPAVVAALDRNTRMIYHLAGKMKIDPETDVLQKEEKK